MTKKNLLSSTEENVVLFNDDTIRREWYNDERYYSVVDIIAVLAQSSQPSRYWTDLKNRLIKDEWFSELFAKCEKLKFKWLDWKMHP